MNKAKIHENRKETWQTPSEIFEPLHKIFNFTIDLAANEENHLLPSWVGPGSSDCTSFLVLGPNDLKNEIGWLNPPYGKNLKPFTKHLAYLWRNGVPIVALLPGSIDTNWFWRNIYPEAPMYGRCGRIQFLPRGKSGNTGPSILCVGGNWNDRPLWYPLWFAGWRPFRRPFNAG